MPCMYLFVISLLDEKRNFNYEVVNHTHKGHQTPYPAPSPTKPVKRNSRLTIMQCMYLYEGLLSHEKWIVKSCLKLCPIANM